MVVASTLLLGSTPSWQSARPSPCLSPHTSVLERARRSLSPKTSSLGAALSSPRPTSPLKAFSSIGRPDDFAMPRSLSPQPFRFTDTTLQGVLESCTSSQERERLYQQTVDLRKECQDLVSERSKQEQFLASQDADVRACNAKCAHLEATIQQMKEKLLEGEVRVGDAARSGFTLEAAVDEYRVKLAIGDRSEDNLRLRLGVALNASGGLFSEHAHLERKSHLAAAEMPITKAELSRTIEDLKSAEDDNVTAEAALELAVGAGRRRVQEVSAEARSVFAEMWAFADELPRAQGELAVIDEQLAAYQDRIEAREVDAQRRTVALEERKSELQEAAACAAKQMQSCREEEVALRKIRAESEACNVELEQCKDTQYSLKSQLAYERETTRAEEQMASCKALQASGIEEQRSVDASTSEERRRQMFIAANMLHADLRSELSHAHDVVSRSKQSLSAIREQLLSLSRISAHLEISEHEAEEKATEFGKIAATNIAMYQDVLKRAKMVKAETAALQNQLALASGTQDSHIDTGERECRNMALQVAQLRVVENQRQEIVTAEEKHRMSVEERLRQQHFDLEEAWETDRAALEERKTRLARELAFLDGDHQRAEADLKDVQAMLEVRLAKNSEADQHSAADLEAMLLHSRNADQDPEQLQLTRGLTSEVAELKAEQGRMRQAIKRVEALNAGLRAQVHVFQQQHAEGASVNGRCNTMGILSPRTKSFGSTAHSAAFGAPSETWRTRSGH